MPCYQVNTIKTEFPVNDFSLLNKAAQSLGFQIQNNQFITPKGIITIENGVASSPREAQTYVNSLRVQYSREIVKHAALKKGWQSQAVGQNKYLLRKQ